MGLRDKVGLQAKSWLSKIPSCCELELKCKSMVELKTGGELVGHKNMLGTFEALKVLSENWVYLCFCDAVAFLLIPYYP